MRDGLVILAVLLSVAAAPTTRPATKGTVVAFFDFEPAGQAGQDMGRTVGEAIAMKLARHEEFVLVDRFSLQEVLAGAGLTVTSRTSADALARLGRESLGAHILVWGKVDREGDRFTIVTRVLDLTGTKPDLYVDRAFPADGYREVPFAVQRIVNAIRRDTDAPDPAIDPREPGPVEADPKILTRPNLVKNGDFEKGEKTPDAWEPVNGLTSFLVDAPDRPGKCLMFDTDVNAAQWLAWNRRFSLGTADPPPRPLRGKGPKYDTVGGTYGAWLYTADFIALKKGMAYRLSFDFRGPGGGKVLVKAYAQFPDQRREVYRAQKNCRTKTAGRQWEHFTMTFNPTAKTPDARWMKVELFCYWPPTVYYFDNIHLCEE